MSFCSIVHVLQGFHQPPKRTKTNTLRLAVQRISYLLLRKVTDRFGTQEDQFVWDLLRAGGRCFFEMDGTPNSNSQSSALIYRCTINVCLPSHRNQVGQGENNWECINQRYQCFFLQSSLCLLGIPMFEDGQKVMIQLKRFFTAARVNPLWSPPLLPVADSVFIDILAGTWA